MGVQPGGARQIAGRATGRGEGDRTEGRLRSHRGVTTGSERGQVAVER